MALYTPFVERTISNISNAYLGREQRTQQDQEKKLFGQAYMGDPQALQRLAEVRPELAMEVEKANRQKQQDTMATKTAQQKALGGILENAAKFNTFEEAQAYTDQQVQGAGLTDIPPLTQEAYDQAKTIYGGGGGADISAASPKDFTIESMAQYETTGDRGVLERFTPPENVSDRQSKINELIKRLNGSVDDPAATAADIVDRRLDIDVNEQTGKVLLIDKVAAAKGEQAVTELPMGNFEQIEKLPEGVPTLYELAEKSTGVVSAVKAGVSRVLGQVGGPVYEETLEARQTMNTVLQDLVRALSINPRFPVSEMERIREETNLTPSIINSKGALHADMRALNRALTVRAGQARFDAKDPSLPEDVRAAQAYNARTIDNFLVQLGIPKVINVSELVTLEEVQGHTTEDLRAFMSGGVTEKEFDAMPEEIKSAIWDRF